jgi:hypothetical protein
MVVGSSFFLKKFIKCKNICVWFAIDLYVTGEYADQFYMDICKMFSVSLLYIVTTMYIKESGKRISDMECLLYMCCLWDRI